MDLFTDKNVKYELTEEFPIDVRLKKISKLHEIIVLFSVFFLKWKYCQY